MAASDRRRSTVWQFFTICTADASKASCSEKLARGGKTVKSFTTSNLKKHLRLCHLSAFKEMEEKEREATRIQQIDRGQSSKQVSLEVIVERSKQLLFDSPRARKITMLIGEMIAVDNQPFSVVGDIGFGRLVNFLEPRYQIPSRKYFSETLIPELYEKVKVKVKVLLANQQHVSCTTDIWSSIS